MRQTLLASAAAPFAHLLGLPKARGAAAETDDPKRDPDAATPETDENATDDTPPAEDTEDGKKGKKGKKANKADDDGTDADAENGDGEDDVGDGTSMENMDDDEKKAFHAGRRAERTRCAAIFAAPAAGVRPDVAAQLAFKTKMNANEAIGVLTAAASGGRPGRLAEAMGAVRIPNPGAEGAAPAQNGASATAAAIIAAGKRRRGEA